LRALTAEFLATTSTDSPALQLLLARTTWVLLLTQSVTPEPLDLACELALKATVVPAPAARSTPAATMPEVTDLVIGITASE
jgi:hypothetical protein